MHARYRMLFALIFPIAATESGFSAVTVWKNPANTSEYVARVPLLSILRSFSQDFRSQFDVTVPHEAFLLTLDKTICAACILEFPHGENVNNNVVSIKATVPVDPSVDAICQQRVTNLLFSFLCNKYETNRLRVLLDRNDVVEQQMLLQSGFNIVTISDEESHAGEIIAFERPPIILSEGKH